MLPLLGLGTYQLLGDQCTQTVRRAIEMGYRHIDTAFAYDNQEAIGDALKGFNRAELFITSKILVDLVGHVRVEKKVEKLVQRALEELGTDYLDLMLIHWPEEGYALDEIFRALERQVAQGLLRSAGVSNYTRNHLQDAYDAGLVVPYNQVEFHPYLYQKELLEFSKAHGTQLIAFRPFGKGNLLKIEPLFEKIGEKHGKTGAQVILRWIVQKGIPVVPKASSEAHLKENLNIFDFELSEEEMADLDSLGNQQRFCMPDSSVFDY